MARVSAGGTSGRRSASVRAIPDGPVSPARVRTGRSATLPARAQLFQRDLRGSNFSYADFTGAQLAESNLQGADLGGACLVGASLLGATINTSANLDGVVFCRTLMPDGTTNNSGCGNGTRCCPTPAPICRTCAASNCILPDTVCSIFGTPCCPGMACTATPVGVVTSCQAPCDSDQDCVKLFGEGIKCCSGQSLLCPFFPGARCCQQPGSLTC